MPDENSTPKRPKLLTQVRHAIRVRHLSRRTERAYVGWILRFVRFHDTRHPDEMGEQEVAEFLNWLAVERKVSASTQNQALAALLFLYRRVLDREVGWLDELVRAKRPRSAPVVMSSGEVARLLSRMDGTPGLMARVLYGSGLRLMECCRLRVKDLDFSMGTILVRRGKGGRDRVTPLPQVLHVPLRDQLQVVRALHERDLREGAGWVETPEALARKYA